MTRITATRPAGPDHQVVTVQGGRRQDAYRRTPCQTCPWRLDAVGEFPAEAFRHSARTAHDMSTRTFACHASGTAKPAICAGFLLRGAAHNMAVRLMLLRGELDLSAVSDGGHALYADYRAMAEANEVRAGDPALRGCR